jgi:hypothetical protein
MKEVLLQTGSFEEVDLSVKDQDTYKPVTKTMLREIYKWDES